MLIEEVEEVEVLVLRGVLLLPLRIFREAPVVELLQPNFDLQLRHILLLLHVRIVVRVGLVFVGPPLFLDSAQEVRDVESLLAIYAFNQSLIRVELPFLVLPHLCFLGILNQEITSQVFFLSLLS